MRDYIVRVIIPDGKNKLVIEENIQAYICRVDVNNNLVFEDENGELIIQYHSYNWLSLRPASVGI